MGRKNQPGGCKCCSAIQICNGINWPTPLYLTTGGVMYTMNYNPGLVKWQAANQVFTQSSIGADCVTGVSPTITITFEVECISGVVYVRYFLALTPCPPTGGTQPCRFCSAGAGTSSGARSQVPGTVASFTQSPVAGTGTWTTWLPASVGCTGPPPIPVSGGWTLSQ